MNYTKSADIYQPIWFVGYPARNIVPQIFARFGLKENEQTRRFV